jgi:hypothetical protein
MVCKQAWSIKNYRYVWDVSPRKEETSLRRTYASLGGVATCGVGSDRIARRRWLVRLHHPRSVKRFRCAISSRVRRSHLSLSLITSPRLDLGFLVRIRKNFFDLLCCKTFQVRDTLESGLTPNEGQHSTTAYPEPPKDTWVLPPWRRSYTRWTKVDCWDMTGR